MDPDGSNPTRLTHENGYGFADWWSNGTSIHYGRSIGNMDWKYNVMSADGSNQTNLFDGLSFGYSEIVDWDPLAGTTWSPNYDKIVFSTYEECFDESGKRFDCWRYHNIYTMEADGTGITKLTDSAGSWWRKLSLWSPSGKIDYLNPSWTPGGRVGYVNPSWSPDRTKAPVIPQPIPKSVP